jgi:hypothetical protein
MSAVTPSLFPDAARGRAYISEDGLYRYSLTREVAPGAPNGTCTFIMLNPSTADAEHDDPTIRRCIGFACAWGFERLKVVNLYAYRATNPSDLWLADDPIGPDNDHVLSLVFGGSDLLIAAWGCHAKLDRVAEILSWPIRPRLCLGLTKAGQPRHPLYLKGDLMPRPLAGESHEDRLVAEGLASWV